MGAPPLGGTILCPSSQHPVSEDSNVRDYIEMNLLSRPPGSAPIHSRSGSGLPEQDRGHAPKEAT